MKSFFALLLFFSFSETQAQGLEPLRPESEKKQIQTIKESLRGQPTLVKDPAVQISTTDGAQVISDSPARKLQEDLDPLGLFLEGSSSDPKKADETVQ